MELAKFVDVVGYAQKAIDLLKKEGDAVVDALKTGFELVQAVTKKDIGGVLIALSKEKKDVEEIIAAIKDAFGLKDGE